MRSSRRRATDSAGHVRFEPGLSRGSRRIGAGLHRRRGRQRRLRLSRSPADGVRSDRSRRQGPRRRAAARCAGLHRARRLSLGRNGLHHRASARRQRHRQDGLPFTLVANRPDGVEYKRAADRGSGRRRPQPALPLLLSAPATAHGASRPMSIRKAAPLGETSFLVEDYVPERLDFTLKPRETQVRGRRPDEIDAATRYPLRRAGLRPRCRRRGDGRGGERPRS